MPRAVQAYVRFIDALNRRVGRIIMYLIFVMMGVLLFSSLSRIAFGTSHIWIVEMSQFLLTGYYLLGGGYSMQLDSHVRMDLLYSRWSPRGKAAADVVTICMLIFYLAFLLVGGLSSTQYALEYGQKNYSAWAPPLTPIKIIMCIGITMMLLQAVATFFKDLATIRGETLA